MAMEKRLNKINTSGLSDEAKVQAEQANRMIDRENARREHDGEAAKEDSDATEAKS
jgi:hypothetical protein